MRFIFIPEELSPIYLAELREVPLTLSSILIEQIYRDKVLQGQLESALTRLEPVFSAAWAEQDRHTSALALLYKADVLRRLQHWEDALELVRRARGWLRMQTVPVAHYNEAIASYLEGLIHYTLRADDKTLQSFVHAQELLIESERHWRFEAQRARISDSQNVQRWMHCLLELRPLLADGGLTMIVPVYELDNDHHVCTGALNIDSFPVVIPSATLRKHLPSDYIPLNTDHFSFFYLDPEAHYIALKITADEEFVPESRAGDLLLLEGVSPNEPHAPLALSEDKPFVRVAEAGHVFFRPLKRTHAGFRGIPRVLIREGEQSHEK